MPICTVGALAAWVWRGSSSRKGAGQGQGPAPPRIGGQASRGAKLLGAGNGQPTEHPQKHFIDNSSQQSLWGLCSVFGVFAASTGRVMAPEEPHSKCPNRVRTATPGPCQVGMAVPAAPLGAACCGEQARPGAVSHGGPAQLMLPAPRPPACGKPLPVRDSS